MKPIWPFERFVVMTAERLAFPPSALSAGAFRARSPAGVPEVLSFNLPGGAARAKVRAILLGSRIDTRELEGYAEPGELDGTSSGVAFVFRYGAVVLFGASEQVEREFVARLDGRIIDPVLLEPRSLKRLRWPCGRAMTSRSIHMAALCCGR